MSVIQVLSIYSLILLNQPALERTELGKDWAKALSSEIVKSSEKHGVDASLIAAIMMQESGYRLDVVAGEDYGLMQVNQYNIDAKRLDKKRLLNDMVYSIDQGVSILRWFKDTYQSKEPELWFSRYNCGTGKIRSVCKRYAKGVKRYMPRSKIKLDISKNKP